MQAALVLCVIKYTLPAFGSAVHAFITRKIRRCARSVVLLCLILIFLEANIRIIFVVFRILRFFFYLLIAIMFKETKIMFCRLNRSEQVSWERTKNKKVREQYVVPNTLLIYINYFMQKTSYAGNILSTKAATLVDNDIAKNAKTIETIYFCGFVKS